jgi:ubiquinone/menaquinone biosynthesis C-methylase UbiE
MIKQIYCKWLFPVLEMHATRGLDRDRDRLLTGLEGNVLEIGSGAGQNFSAMDKGKVEVFALEPSEGLTSRALEEKSRSCSRFHLVRGKAEQLPFADNSMDAVISFLVLCSVESQSAVLQEIVRVLKPGKPFLFFEHVLSEKPGVQKWQNRLNPIWKKVGCGCQLNRNTWQSIQSAGLVEQEYKFYAHHNMGPSLTHNIIEGRALKPADS